MASLAASSTDDRLASFRQSRSLSIRKTLRDVMHKPGKRQDSQTALPLPAWIADDFAQQNELAYDVLYECQRGSWTVGYSSKTLLQIDPSPWCDGNMEYTPMDIKTYQLPDPTWQWVMKDWMVHMSNDVDEGGWQYAFDFHCSQWHGNYKHFRSFVRRRKWIRLRSRPRQRLQASEEENHDAAPTPFVTYLDNVTTRRLIDVDDSSSQHDASLGHPGIKDEGTLYTALKACRLDRERLRLIDDALAEDGMVNTLLNQATKYIRLFDFESTKQEFLSRLFAHKDASTLTLTPEAKAAIQELRFYSDIEHILKHF